MHWGPPVLGNYQIYMQVHRLPFEFTLQGLLRAPMLHGGMVIPPGSNCAALARLDCRSIGDLVRLVPGQGRLLRAGGSGG